MTPFRALFGALECSGCSRRDLLSRGSKKVSKKGAFTLTLRPLFGAVLAPWATLGAFRSSQTSKMTVLQVTRFWITFLRQIRAPSNVLRSVLAAVSARFSHFRRVSKRVKNGLENGAVWGPKSSLYCSRGSLERFWESFLQFRNDAKKSDETKTSGCTFGSGPAECAEAVGGRRVRNIMQNLNV